MIRAVIAHNITNPKTGLTIKQENMQLEHKIPLNTLVEINCDYNDAHGCRMFVAEHTRDCDGTPMYALSFERAEYFTSFDKHIKEILEKPETEDTDLDLDKARKFKALSRQKMCGGWCDKSLIVIREAQTSKEN